MTENGNYSIGSVIARSEPLIAARRLKSTLTLYRRAHDANPDEPVFMYQLGALNYCHLGNGLEARRLFQAALAARSSGAPESVKRLKANASENLMLLSLSYEEYESYAAQLERIEPRNPILIDHRARVREGREQGLPWHVILGGIALMHHNPHDPRNAERYGECAATWHLFVTHRKDLRVPRREQRHGLIGYSTALMQCSASAGLALRAALGADEPEEVLFLLEPARPILREYLAENPEDQPVQQTLDAIERSFDLRRYQSRPGGGAPAATEKPRPSEAPQAFGCAVLLVGATLGSLAGRLWIVKAAFPWNAIIGAFFGLVAAAGLLGQWQRARGQG
jgi:tetratricopeptide (TPR) repeat protein